MLSCFSCVQLSVTLWMVAHQAPLSMGFSRQEYWNGLSLPPQGIFPLQVSNVALLGFLHWQMGPLPMSHLESPVKRMPGCKFQLHDFLVV